MILVRLLVLVSACLATLKSRSNHFDVEKERSLGLENLHEQLQKRFQALSWRDIIKAMVWMVRHQKLDLAEELLENKPNSSCLLGIRNIKTILRYFPDEIRKEIIHDIVIESERTFQERSALAIIKAALNSRYHLVEGRDMFLGALSLLPEEIFLVIMKSLNPNELMNMMLCCWDIRDLIAELVRSKCHRYDEQDRVWTLCPYKLHQHWTTTTDEQDKKATELILCSNLQVSLLMETIINGSPFKCGQWQLYYHRIVEKVLKEDSDKRAFPYWQDSFDGWVKEFASVIQPSVLDILIKSDRSIEVSWRTIKYAIERKMRASAVLILISNVCENQAMSRSIVSLAVDNGYDSQIILPCIKAQLLVYHKLYKEELEMAVKYSRSSEDLMEILELSEPNHTTVPTHRTVRRLLGDKFNEECCNLFFDKYPFTQVGPEHVEIVNSRDMSPTLLARLLLSNDQMQVSASMMEKLPGDVPEDFYLLFLCRTNVPLSPQKVIEAMQRKFGEPTIRFMLRTCSRSLKVHHIESLKQGAIENGYSKDLLEFIPSLLGL